MMACAIVYLHNSTYELVKCTIFKYNIIFIKEEGNNIEWSTTITCNSKLKMILPGPICIAMVMIATMNLDPIDNSMFLFKYNSD